MIPKNLLTIAVDFDGTIVDSKTVYYKARRMDYDEKPNDAVRAANLFAFL